MGWKPKWTERQQPLGDEVFLDHVGWFVEDLEKASSSLKNLGFHVSRENVHMNRQADGSSLPSGTVNRLITPALGYLEFLGSRGDTPLAKQHKAQLSRYEGLHLMAFAASNVPAEAPRLREKGFEPLKPVDMRRMTLTARGIEEEARFSVLRVPPKVMPEGRIQWCGHFTPELVWEPGGTDQPNAVDALSGVLWVVEDLEEATERFAKFVRKPSVLIDDGIAVIVLERGVLVLVTEQACSKLLPNFENVKPPYGAAVLLRSRDIAKTEKVLQSAGVTYDRCDGRLFLSPNEALGSFMIIHPVDLAPLSL